MNEQSFVYILTNRKHGALYIGVTNDLIGALTNTNRKRIAGWLTFRLH